MVEGAAAEEDTGAVVGGGGCVKGAVSGKRRGAEFGTVVTRTFRSKGEGRGGEGRPSPPRPFPRYRRCTLVNNLNIVS